MIERSIYCPYCGERISVLVDHSVPDQRYTEDCEVCCRPIVIDTTIDQDGSVVLQALTESD